VAWKVGSATSATVTTLQKESGPPTAPTANFSANPTSGQAPLSVQFTDQSSGSITSRDWNFGDGSSHSSALNPSHTYNNAGSYTVTLTVTGSGGSNSKSLTIQVNTPPPPAPTANFSANPTSGNAPLSVQFSDQSSGSITSRDWDFGDGSSHSSALNPSHTYNNAGSYTVTLTVSGSGGSNSKSVTIQVSTPPPPAPTANFTANPTSGNAPLTVQFTDQSSGSITSRDWNFGDGSSHSTALSPSHTYNNAGSYTATLTVTGSGGSNSKSVTIQVSTPPPPPPTANFTANPTSGNAPLTVQFTDQSSGSITSRDWNFGDGSSHSTALSPSHTYNNAGSYTATLTVTGSGGSNSKSVTIQVNTPPPPPPTANFTANPTSGNAPLTVQFTDQSSGSITSRDWNFGDGSAHSTALSPSHTYNNAGTYTVTLTVTGSGGSNSKSVTIQANTPPPPAPTANFTANPTSGNAPVAVQFTD